MLQRRILLVFVSVLVVLLTGSLRATEVVSVFPQGAVKKVQQVTVRFSSDMVAMGDPRSVKDPFKMDCKTNQKTQPAFKTRWADNRNWSLDFDKPLEAGIRCTLKAAGNLKDLAGEKVDALQEYTFSTAGPALLGVAPIYGQIEPEQYFVALTDGPMDLKSVAEGAYFEVSGMPDKVKATVITPKDRTALIEAAIKDNWRWRNYRKLKKYDAFIILGASRRFPENADVVLHWTKGIKSQSGLAVEEEQAFNFRVVPKFEATFNCERTAPDRPCNPILDMRVNFSNRLPLAALKGAKLVASDGKTWVPVELQAGDQNQNVSTSVPGMHKNPVGVQVISNFEDKQVSSLTFKAPFPEKASFSLTLPAGLKDELGRPLDNQKSFPLATATDEYSPLLKFAAPFGILELKADPILPVSVRNIEKKISTQQVVFEGKTLNIQSMGDILKWYARVNAKDYDYSKRNTALLGEKDGTKFEVQKPATERDFELLGIPLKKPGFYVVEMNSKKLGDALTGQGPMFVSTSALVTDLAVHYKKGRESSLVWVTQLSDARPVAKAKITLTTNEGRELAKGETDASGILKFGRLNYPCGFDSPEHEETNSCEVFAFAQKDNDLSFASSEWAKGIETYRFNTPTEYLSKQWGPYVMHTVLDRMAAQPGEAVNMKHYLREHTATGFGPMKDSRLPKRVLVVHQGSQKTYTLPFDFDKASGSATGKFSIPKNAQLGTYSVYLSNTDKMPSKEGDEPEPFDWSAQQTGSFVVAEYRLPLMKANVTIQGRPLIAPKEAKLDVSASYLSGGPARGLKVKLRTNLSRGYFSPTLAGGRDFNFYSDAVTAGVRSNESDEEGEESAFLKVQDAVLGQEGGTTATIAALPKITKVQTLAVEMEYTDPNGEVKTASASATAFPSDLAVGLRTENWVAEPGKVKASGIIVNTDGKPQPNRDYKVEAFRTDFITHRKRLVGGFYAYESKNETKSLGKVCEGKSNQDGEFKCEPKGLPAGSVTLQASIADDKGRLTYSSVRMSVFDEGADSWWAQGDSDRIDLLPTKNRFEPGEKASFILRTPYPVATALITVEREGVLESFVTEIKREKPVIEIPMKGSYAPNIFVSALLVRGRVAAPQPTALLDLARPSMKMGLVDLNVGWRDHELLVTVKTDKQKYKTGEKIEATIQVKTASGAPLPAGSEVALAAVDEALMRLKENTSWKILAEMMGHRSLAVATSSGQNQVIGRRHFGSKAKSPGGGGGRETGAENRENFDPLLLWQPRLKLDKNGTAKITIPLNDSISSFRIVAVASAGVQFFGDGKTTVETSKDLILYSGFAPLAREGDQIRNAFTIRNTTAKAMKVEFDFSSKQLPTLAKLPALDLKASEAKTLELPLTVPNGIQEIAFQLKARDTLSGSQDAMVAKVRVEPAVPPRVLQATLFQLEKSQTVPVKQAADALPNVGGLRVSARSSLVQGLAGVKSYMEGYSYTCLEQRLSTSIALENKVATQDLVAALPAYLDGSGLLKFFPNSLCGSAQLTRYAMNILDENSVKIPQATRDQMVRGLKKFVEGRYNCNSWWDTLVRDPYTSEARILALETLSRYKSFTPAPLTSLQITPNLWKNETVTAWYQLLKREKDVPKRDAELKKAENILRSRVNFQGSLMNLQGDLDWEGQWRLFTSRDQEALGVFGLFIDEPGWGQDVGRMARGVVARLKLGHWDTTMANAWGVTQMRKFSAKFEKEKVTGETKITAAEVKDAVDWKKTPNGDIKTLNWPKESKTTSVQVKFEQAGTGKPWVHLEIVSAIPLKAPLDFGYQISRKITAVTQATRGQWKTGDVANIELTVTAKADQAWVVVRDPVPAGSSHLGNGLSGSSNLLDRAPKKKTAPGEVLPWPSEFDEKSFAHFTSYAAYLPRGIYTLNYRVRLNSAGDFKLPPTRVEAMYAPETFGEAPNANWKIAN
jgi:uncharacterized protein YfaS (alpha-2-macroglobulin family)